MKNQHRRDFLRLGAAAMAGLATGAIGLGRRQALAQPSPDQKFLFVIAASGGASITDSFLPVLQSQVSSPDIASQMIAYPDAAVAQPTGSNIRCVKNLGVGEVFTNGYDMETFVTKYRDDMAVMTVENTSVNHVVAQKRAITGAGIDSGRTIQEAMAIRHGKSLFIPNCNMGSGAYTEPGDGSVPANVRPELISNALAFPLAMDGIRGVAGAPARSIIEQARLKRQELEQAASFGKKNADSALRNRFLEMRTTLQPQLEEADLITKLMMLQEGGTPLSAYDLESSPEAMKLASVFPNLLEDRLEAQAGLAYLLALYGVSAAMTIGPSFAPNFLGDGTILDTPLAFDFSHNDHLNSQQVMWGRLCETLDGLISLLKQAPHGSGSMWDSSLIYVATDFGRTKTRPANATSFGTGHDLNNGNLFISPMLKGNRVYGGVDPDTCKTYGFDLSSGDPAPGTYMREGHLYSLIAQAMDIDFAGRHDMSVMLA